MGKSHLKLPDSTAKLKPPIRRAVLIGAVACLLAVAAVPASSHSDAGASAANQLTMDTASWTEVARSLEDVVDPRALLGAEVTSADLESHLAELGWTLADYRGTAQAMLETLQAQYECPAAMVAEATSEFPLPDDVTIPWVAPPAPPATDLGPDLELVRRLLTQSRGSWDEEDDAP